MLYNKFEMQIAKKLKRYPHIYGMSKFMYKRASYVFYGVGVPRSDFCPGANINRLINCNEQNLEAFFGYYDKSPWSYDSKYYLLHLFDRGVRDKVKIAIYDCTTSKLNVIDETKAFNFQQGAMLRWLDAKSYFVIYNTVENGNLVAKIKDIVSGSTIRTIPIPIQAVNHKGTEALTLNYKRLDRLRPEYGYKVAVKNFSPDTSYAEDGIWTIDLNTNKHELVIKLEDLITLDHDKSMDKSQHKINHIMYSPSGKRFVFMHRWVSPHDKYSRLYTANTDGSDICCLADDKIVSHYCWMNDNNLIVWMRKRGKGDKYFLIRDGSSEFEAIGRDTLNMFGDGHPSISPDNKWMITDTYIDKARMRKLILFNMKTEKKIIIASLFAPWVYDGAYRCDLHPRWSPDGTKVSIDSVHEGYRNSYMIDIAEITKADTEECFEGDTSTER